MFFNNFSKKQAILKAVVTLGILLLSQPAMAADNHQNPFAKNAAPGCESEFHFQELKKYEALPDFPTYSGQTLFVHGVVYPQARGGSSTTCTMIARESKDTVMHWYQDALKMYKWNVGGEQSNDGVRASKGSNFVEIMVTPPTKRGYGCDITITYRTAVH